MKEGASTTTPLALRDVYTNLVQQNLEAKLKVDWPTQLCTCAGFYRPDVSEQTFFS